MDAIIAPYGEDAGATASVSLLRLDDDADIALSAAWALLSPEEAERAGRLRFDLDRRRFVRRRALLRLRLGAWLDAPAIGIALLAGPDGKPRLAGDPVHFNLSHAGGFAALALSQAGPVGVDLEQSARAGGLISHADAWLTAGEAQALERAPEEERAARMLDFWTAKEARMKLTGEGLSLDPRRVELALEGGRPVGYRRPETPAAALRFVTFPEGGLTCSLATLVKSA